MDDELFSLRNSFNSKSSFIAMQLRSRGGVDTLLFGHWISAIDGVTGFPAVIGLDAKTGRGEERIYQGRKYNVPLYFALSGGPIGYTGSGRVSCQLIAEFPQFIMEKTGEPISIEGDFGITTRKEGTRTISQLWTEVKKYREAIEMGADGGHGPGFLPPFMSNYM